MLILYKPDLYCNENRGKIFSLKRIRMVTTSSSDSWQEIENALNAVDEKCKNKISKEKTM